MNIRDNYMYELEGVIDTMVIMIECDAPRDDIIVAINYSKEILDFKNDILEKLSNENVERLNPMIVMKSESKFYELSNKYYRQHMDNLLQKQIDYCRKRAAEVKKKEVQNGTE